MIVGELSLKPAGPLPRRERKAVRPLTGDSPQLTRLLATEDDIARHERLAEALRRPEA